MPELVLPVVKDGQVKNFANDKGVFETHTNIALDYISKDIVVTDVTDDFNKINPIANIWARPILTSMVLKDEKNPLYNYFFTYCVYLLSKIALKDFRNLDIKILHIDLNGNAKNKETNAFRKILQKQKPKNKLNLAPDWDKLYIILEKGIEIGFLSPSTFVSHGVNYLELEDDINKKTLLEILHLNSIEKKAFALWLNELNKLIHNEDEEIKKPLKDILDRCFKDIYPDIDEKYFLDDIFYTKHINIDNNVIEFDNALFNKLQPIDVSSFLDDKLNLITENCIVGEFDSNINKLEWDYRKFIPILPFKNIDLFDVEKGEFVFKKDSKDISLKFEDILFEKKVEPNSTYFLLTIKITYDKSELSICKKYDKNSLVIFIDESKYKTLKYTSLEIGNSKFLYISDKTKNTDLCLFKVKLKENDNVFSFNTEKIKSDLFNNLKKDSYFHDELYIISPKLINKEEITYEEITTDSFEGLDSNGDKINNIPILPIKEKFMSNKISTGKNNNYFYVILSIEDENKNEYKIKSLYLNTTLILEQPDNFIYCIYPNFKLENWKLYYIFNSYNKHSKFSIIPFFNKNEFTRKDITEDENKILCYQTSEFPEIAICKNGDKDIGFIKIKSNKIFEGDKAINVGIDFGSTSTNIFTSTNTENEIPQLLNLEEPRVQMIFKPETTAISKIYDYFIPSIKGETENMEAPILSSINKFGKDEELFLNKNIYFQYKENKENKNITHISGFKWEDQADNIKPFLSQVLLQILVNLVKEGINSVDLSYSYPDSFGDNRAGRMKVYWEALIDYYKQKTDINIKLSKNLYSESKATSLYFSSVGAVDSQKGVITIDIGGSTSDIGLIYNQKLEWYSSLKFAGRDLFLSRFRKKNNKKILEGIYTNVNKQVKDRIDLLNDDLLENDFYSIIDSIFKLSKNTDYSKIKQIHGFKDFIQPIYLAWGGILFYIGMSITSLEKVDSNEIGTLCIGGNGTKILDWMGNKFEGKLVSDFLETFFNAGLGSYPNDFYNIISKDREKYNLEFLLRYNYKEDESTDLKNIFDNLFKKVDDKDFTLKISENPKSEVAMGIIYTNNGINDGLKNELAEEQTEENKKNKKSKHILYISGEKFILAKEKTERNYNTCIESKDFKNIDFNYLDNIVFTLVLFNQFFYWYNKEISKSDVWINSSDLILTKKADQLESIIKEVKTHVKVIINGYTDNSVETPAYILALKELLNKI